MAARRATIDVPKSLLRWPLLFLQVNATVIISSLALCFSSASVTIAQAYNVPLVYIAMCGISYTATYIPTTFASMYLYSKLLPH